MHATSEIWWKQITGARNFLQKTADTLAGGKSVVMCLAESTPWLDDMREILIGFLNKNFGGRKVVREVDASEVASPEKFLLENFCSEDVREEFISFGEEDAHVKFLAGRDDIILNDVCLWIRDADKFQAEKWFSFIGNYHKFLRGKNGGVFLLETGTDCELGGKSGVEIFSCENEISDYDCFAFNTFIAAEFGTGDKFTKRYLAELAANATGVDVERGAECIKNGSEFLRNPAAVLTNKSRDEIDRAVWITQLKLIFPLLEIFRRDFTEKYFNRIERRLPYAASDKKTICTPDEAELGELYSMFIGGWEIDSDDWEKLKNYREARNKLAHLDTLTLSQVQTILHC